MRTEPDSTVLDMDFDAAVLGAGLSPDVESLIAQAGAVRSEHAQAESLLLKAKALAPTHPATLIALYRFYFYGHKLTQAREVSVEALRVARAALEPVSDASEIGGLKKTVDDEQARFDAAVRFYLFSLKGYAYLCLRMGDIETGRTALDELKRLDPQDRVGGGVLAHVLARAHLLNADDDESAEALAVAMKAAHVPRGWGAP